MVLQSFKKSPDVVGEIIDNEAILINMKTGIYYSLRETAMYIWQLMDLGLREKQLVSVLGEKYDREASTISAEISEFLQKLSEEELILAAEGQSVGASELLPELDGIAAPQSYSQPEVEIYRDLQELLLVDPIHEVDDSGWASPISSEEKV